MNKKPDQEKPKASGRYRKVEVRTWGDAKFRELSPIPPCGQGLWLFLITGPHTGPIPGLFRAGRAAMAEDLDWPLEAFDKAFGEAFRLGMVQADFKARVVWVPNAIKHNKPESPNVVKSWASEFDLIPECDLKWNAFDSLKASIHALGEAYAEAFNKAFVKPSWKPSLKASPKTIGNQEQEQEQEQDGKDANASLSATAPPTASAPDIAFTTGTPSQPTAAPAAVNHDHDGDEQRVPPCPVKQLVGVFAAKVPDMPKPRAEVFSDSQGATDMRQRWKWVLTAKREDTTRYATNANEALEWFGKFFDVVASSDFLCGRGKDSWDKCTLAWLMKRDNFGKVIEGNYDNDRRRKAA